MPASKERLEWFNEARFGMFIHWGLYSILGKGEWVRYHEEIPTEEYRALANQFNPQYYRPREWAALAKAAGMRYMVMTAKHHDGFCLFDSQFTDFTSVKTAAKRDFIREYVEACRAEGLAVGIYFSVKDWEIPAYFRGPENDPEGFDVCVQHFHNQALELMSNYGKIDLLFYDCSDDANFYGNWGDISVADLWRSKELNDKIRELQPGILINDRSGMPEDYGTPENTVLITVEDNDRMYETCMTMNNSWGFNRNDHNWKSTDKILSQLISCAARGCNYLLNVGPDPEGRIPQDSVQRLQEVGFWMKENGEAVYGTERILPSWWDSCPGGRITTKQNVAYLCLNRWPVDGTLLLTRLKNEVVSASLLNGDILPVQREGRRVLIEGLPIQSPTPWANVIKLVLDGAPAAQYHY